MGAGNRGGIRLVVASTLGMVVALWPAYMLGASAVLVRDDLQFSQRALGLAVAAFFGAFASTSAPAGRLADRLGPRVSLRAALAVSGVGTAGIMFAAPNWGWLVFWLVPCGVAAGLMVPSAGLALVSGVNLRTGLLFGVSQSAAPATTLIGGLGLSSIALALGWRWAFAFGLALVPVVMLLVPSDVPRRGSAKAPEPPVDAATRGGLRLLAVATGLGSASAIAMGSFFVESATGFGHSIATSGMALAIGSAAGICARLLAGWRADRRVGGHLRVVGLMLGFASFGYVLLAFSGPLPFLIGGTLIAYSLGYGWPGLVFHAVSGLGGSRTGSAIGTVNAGAGAGAATGPAIFGIATAQASLELAWLLAAAATLAGSVLVWRAVVTLRRGGSDPKRSATRSALQPPR